MALILALTPWDIFAGAINPVLFPAFAEKQDDRESLCRAVLHITKYTALLLIPPTALVMVYGGTILTIIYGTEYSAVAVPFALLCVYVLLLIQGGIFANVFFGIGQPGKHRTFVGLRALILILWIYPGIKFFGLTGAAAVVVLANFVALFLQVTVVSKTIGLSVLDYMISLLPGLAFAIPILAVVVFVQWLKPDHPVVYLTIGILLYVISCLTGLLSIRRFERLRWF
jgi:O-antigen/teichoic acid export membrane protein